MPDLMIMPEGKHLEYQNGESIMDILLFHRQLIDNPCNGKGTCGKCRIKVLEGEASPASATEQKLLKEELSQGIRLACCTYPKGDLKIQLLHKERKHKILTSGYVPEFAFDCCTRKVVIPVPEADCRTKQALNEYVLNKTGALECCVEPPDMIPEGVLTAVIRSQQVIGLEPGDTQELLYGIAADIGTTTVVCSLVDMRTGEELGSASMVNAQKTFGLDVLTRITYELEHPEDGVERLQSALVESFHQMIGELCSIHRIRKENIYEIAIAANCTMMHMLLGADATPIGRAPYTPLFVESKTLLAKEIGLCLHPMAALYCLPSVSAYIGADIVAGAYVCKLKEAKGNVLFIDIGTNGEIVLSNHGRLSCCSCAAGPALEGMNISSGMRAAEGAIEDLQITEEGVKIQVIDDKAPVGICGSGILAGIRELLRTGLVQKSGAFIKPNQLEESDYRYGILQQNGKKREFLVSDGPNPILITQGDIRQVQLVKGAILSGFIALLEQEGLKMEQLDQVIVAGQFGAHLPVESLTGTGILPEAVKDKIVYVGNSSRTGAYMALMSSSVRQEMEALAEDMDYLELSERKDYERLLSSCLIFPDFSSKAYEK